MPDNIVYLNEVTTLDTSPERVLESAIDRGLETVVVLGYTEEGEEYFSSSVSDGGTVVWLMERLKLKLLDAPDDEE